MITTIIFFILGLIASYFIARWQMKKNRIVHFSINSYDIGKGLSDEFPDFKLHFSDDILAKNVMILKGGFMNTGRNDINGLKGENDIKLILPDECKIKAYKIFSSTEDLIVTANRDNEKENILNLGIEEIFKTDEYFKYTIIIETFKEIRNLHSNLKFRHRISNTDRIKNTYIGLQRNLPIKRLYTILMSFMILLMLLATIIFSHQKIRYNIYKKTDNQEVKIHIDLKSNLYVNEGLYIPFITGTKISSDDLEKEYKIVPVTEFRLNSSDCVMVIWFLFSLICVSYVYFITWGKNGHIMKVLKENEESK